MSKYFIMTTRRHDDFTAIMTYPRAMTYIHKPSYGIRMGADYKEAYPFEMDPESTGLRIADIIHNTVGYLMVSARMKAFLEQHVKAEIEFLRFTLMNHKGRIESDDCHIVNVIGAHDWLDMGKTEGQRHPLEQDRFTRLKRLVLHEDRIAPDANLFRVSPAPGLILVREDLKAQIEAAGFTGPAFLEAGTPIRLVL
ncbi:hypothetical protein D7Y13_11740 [Corallococcus praedator]|uniref:Immunity MXAN-0049 protein domain-containing protein n=1 Tax=Corallococcus praedator TaxID=2316724 RepID=A0ABX9QL48_9BACT|nr:MULTISPECIES: DUF1629 domain-containing protein [Corallococcus]RKH17806.1 hypothetical protein D7X74_11285 [Corallococcus sp. CA047B]RKH34582.1 hypothetical protein D7X75_07750 [Corallococcus sp. CA031C]RKI10994.1 hypothetical protein D7Y13_11740 [Corallococcus praedator]